MFSCFVKGLGLVVSVVVVVTFYSSSVFLYFVVVTISVLVAKFSAQSFFLFILALIIVLESKVFQKQPLAHYLGLPLVSILQLFCPIDLFGY